MGIVSLFSKKILQKISNSLGIIAASVEKYSGKIKEASVSVSSDLSSIKEAVMNVSSSTKEIEEHSFVSAQNAQEGLRRSQECVSQLNELQTSFVSLQEWLESSIERENISIQELKENLSRISEVFKIVQEIAEKTNVINDIVFQTKLLSFNASVEAARAGEHGKGFAVVSEEIGKLAASSGKASVEIN
jgi:methyl-accepting chemotaxis protein